MEPDAITMRQPVLFSKDLAAVKSAAAVPTRIMRSELSSRVDLSTEPQDSILKTNSRVLCRM